MTTYADCNTGAGVALTVDTETEVLSMTIPSGKGGNIKKIRVAIAQVATALDEQSGYLELKLGSHSGPYRFPIGSGVTDGDLTAPGSRGAEEIEVDIPVFANETVKANITLNGDAVGAHVGIIWVSG